ncbi:MAG: hypothetical protein IKW16_01850, partial [Clostridia bacterium]|nr:hypothetical protein [Clostridia bacterium]
MKLFCVHLCTRISSKSTSAILEDSMERIKMPNQAPSMRICNFKEVALGYSKEQAVLEASRCLNCKNAPCSKGCPVG